MGKRAFPATLDDLAHMPGILIGKLWRVSSQTIGQWFRNGMPRNEDLSFNLMQVIQWHQDRAVRLALLNCTSSSVDTDLKSRKAKAEVEILELKKAERAGEVLAVTDVARNQAVAVKRLIARIDLMPDRLATQLVGMSQREEISRILDTALTDLVEDFRKDLGTDIEPAEGQ